MLNDTQLRISVRRFNGEDIPQLLQLMRELARFEDYLDDFAVTERDIAQRGLSDNRQFGLFVAEADDQPGELLGMAVYYLIPYTFDLSPDLVLKELYVAEHARGMGVGRALMSRIRKAAQHAGARRIRWLVLHSNDNAKRFYASLGARPDRKWENWQLALPEPRRNAR